jgi:hypothetical protein
MAIKNEVGNRYGKLVVLKRDEDFSNPKKRKNAYWICQCDCGNTTSVIGTKLRNGETKSCGCLKKESKNVTDITGQKFGHLTVIRRASSTKGGIATWFCKCDCGNPNEIEVTGANLRSGHTISCGCSHLNKGQTDITNHRFGKLIAIKPTSQRRGSNTVWECKCDCGNICYVDVNSLNSEKTLSCGCLGKSKGEFYIQKLLNKANIKFEEQKTFNTCRFPNTNALAKFDFYVDNKYLIEYDGLQHFEYKDNKGWNNKENFIQNQYRDNFKNQWCKENNIPLIRIPYWHYDNLCLEDLLLETSKFIIN